MNIAELIEKNNTTVYALSKKSGIPRTTIFDLCSGKTNIGNASFYTICKLAKALNVSVEEFAKEYDMVDKNMYDPFELFKSNTCHYVKKLGDLKFIEKVLVEKWIDNYLKEKKYSECLYILAMTDYLSRINKIPLCTKYDKLRKMKLKEAYYPQGVVLLDNIENTDKNKKKALKDAIPEFLSHNIIESEIRNVA